MPARTTSMVLTLFLATAGYHKDSWRRPGSRVEDLGTLALISDLAARAEAAKLHAVFMADLVTAKTALEGDPTTTTHYEPITALSALAARTTRIGLIGTASTTFTEPYNLARQFNGLDTLSQGRAGWNIVTSWAGNENFGLAELPVSADRYRRAREFAEVVLQLWDSWEPGAIVNDREGGVWVDPSKVQAIHHVGAHFNVEGPLNLPRSPQGRPVLVQAGSSEDGLDLGSSFADMIYTAQSDRARAIEFYAGFSERLISKGRRPSDVQVLPGIIPIIGVTEAEARELFHELEACVNMDLGRVQVARMMGAAVDDLDLDESIPAERLPEDPSRGSRYEVFRRHAVDQGYSLRRMIIETARAAGHRWIVGTPATIAETMIDWFDNRACDGFSLNPASVPDGVVRICELLVPDLQSRGYFRDDYRGQTLRENLALEDE